MDLVFDRGDRQSPKGHALLYFRSSSNHDELWATYLVVLPITVDVSKYVPPFLMNQMGEVGAKDLSAFAFPPAPEKVPDYDHLEQMAGVRDDDILFGGTINPVDVASAMMSVNEAVAKYSEMYGSLAPAASELEPEADEAPDGASVNEVLYGLMSDGDRLSELTRLVGRLRDASENAEDRLSTEAEAEISLLARHLPENHQVRRLIEAAGGRCWRASTCSGASTWSRKSTSSWGRWSRRSRCWSRGSSFSELPRPVGVPPGPPQSPQATPLPALSQKGGRLDPLTGPRRA